MALRAIGGEACCNVAGVHTGIVVRHVARFAGVRRVGVVPIMALITADRYVRSNQWPNRVVIGRWTPSRGGGVAGGTIRRETRCLVVRVGSAVEILLVTGQAFRRCIGEVPGGMALCTILVRMPHRQREKVVDHIVRVPSSTHWIVAFDAVR